MADKFELIIDLEDGLPPARVETQERAKPTGPGTLIYKAPPHIQVLRVPTAVVISVAPVKCLACGAEHKDHRGVFLEEKMGAHATVLTRKSMKELGAFAKLPRRVDSAPMESVPICSICWKSDEAFSHAVAEAQVEVETPPEAVPALSAPEVSNG